MRSLATRWLPLGAAIAACALAVVLILSSDRDVPLEPPSTLPEPRPPVVSALVAPGHGGLGWTWVSPLPRALPSFHDVDVAGPDLVAMVGFGGEAALFDAAGMLRWETGVETTLHAVAWRGAHEALAVGERGAIRVLRRGAAEGTAEAGAIDAGTDVTLRAVVVTPAGEAWIAGDEGTLLRVTSDRVQAVDAGTDAALLALHRRGEVVWVAGAEGTVLRVVDGAPQAVVTGSRATLRAIGGCPEGDLYAAGDAGRLLRLAPDGRFERVAHPLREALADLGCDRGHAVAVGLRGGVLLAQGARTVVLPSPTDRSLRGVSGGRGAPTWIVGDGGRLLRVERDHLRSLTAGPTFSLRDVGAVAGALVAVGEWGRIARQTERSFRQAESPTQSALAAVASVGEGALVAVGDNGAIVEIDFGSARLLASPTQSHLRDVVAGAGELLAVGEGGVIVRGAPGALREARAGGVGTLWSVTGSPGDAVAVGEGGAVLSIAPGAIARLACDVGVTLRAVHRGDAGTFAVGDEGAIARIEGPRCVVERAPRPGQPALHGLGDGPHGGPLAVGDRGVALVRDAGGGWSGAGLDVGRQSLRAVFRDDRDVWVVGAGGVVVRHARLDGG